MPIPNQALILVADGRKTLFLRNHGDAAELDLRTEAHDERDDRKDRELKSDAPGLSGQSFGFGRPALDEPDYHQQAEDRWAKDTADLLNKRALAGDYDALAIVAPRKPSANLESIFTRKPKSAWSRPSTRK